jgi:hypothetical protein
MAINIRFGSEGDLLPLAKRVGEGQAFDQRFAQGQQLVQQGFAQQAQRESIRLEQQRLDLLSQQQRTNVSRTPTRRSQRSTPFTQSVTQDNADFKQTIPISLAGQEASGGTGNIRSADRTSGFQVDAAGTFTGQELGIELTEEDIQRRSNFVSGQPQQGQGSALANQKLEFLRGLNLPSDQEGQLVPLVNDEGKSIQQFADEVFQQRAFFKQEGITPTAQLGVQERTLRDEASQNQREATAIETQLRAAGVEPLGRETNELIRAVGNKRPLVAMVERLAILRESGRQIQTSRQSLASQGVQQLQQTDAPDDASQVSDDEILRALQGF